LSSSSSMSLCIGITRNIPSHDDHEKSNSWVAISMVLHLAALWVAGAPLLYRDLY